MSALLDGIGDALAKATGLTSTQARGTLRLVLKEHGVDARIARKADYLAILGPALHEALAKRRVTVGAGLDEELRRAIDASPELEDAYDLFKDIEWSGSAGGAGNQGESCTKRCGSAPWRMNIPSL